LIAVTSRVAGTLKDDALNSGYGVHWQLEPLGTESPKATTDKSAGCGGLTEDELLAHPLIKIAHANAATT
jgi:hypothetical protein